MNGYDNVDDKTRKLIDKLYSDSGTPGKTFPREDYERPQLVVKQADFVQLQKKVAELEAEVERLRAHAWEQDRAAVVAFLRGLSFETVADIIERGEHWPEGGTPCTP